MSKYIIRADDLHKHYKMGSADLHVLKGVALEVRAGEFVAVTGSSGCGKSTLLHILGALDKPDAGKVEFEDQDITRFGSSRLNKYRNSQVGFVFQFYHLLAELTVLENIMLPAMISSSVFSWFRGKKALIAHARELAGKLSLLDRLDHKPYQLSGGERQRVAIGRALMKSPPLLLADEPTGNLDCATGNGILEVFENLNRAGQTIIMVTHDQKIAARAHRVIRLSDGVIGVGQ
ncbi:MAG: hypothetical protein A2178_03150 [Planctomycetes bacterium GWC2_49_10]|nr:MAG: hypothetical protein A2178_03150 [Planctomycetes bacterium GWC2_49_10]